jgi:hypothetical protein
VSLLADALFAIFTSGVGRARGRTRFARPARARRSVMPSPWLTAGMAAVTAQGVVLVVCSIAVAVAVWNLMDDDIMFALVALIGIPLASGVLGVVMSILGWLVGVFRKLVELDASARIDLAAAGIGGLFSGFWMAALIQTLLGVVLCLASVAALVVSTASAGWVEQETFDFLVDR